MIFSPSLRLFIYILAVGLACSFTGLWQSLLPVAVLAAFLVVYQSQSRLPGAGRTFLIGFAAGFLLWAGYAWILHIQSNGILTQRIGLLFKGLPAAGLLLVTGLFGALLAGTGALTGRQAALLIARRPQADKR